MCYLADLAITRKYTHTHMPIRGEAPCEKILTKFCTFGDMPDVIICANFGMEKLRSLGNTGGQIFGSPIETTGHP